MTATVVDIQSPQRQQMGALREANVRRVSAHHARLDLRAGRVSLREVLGDYSAGSLRVYEILLDLPACGEVKTRRIVHRAALRCNAGCSFGLRRLRELQPAQRQAILDEARRVLGRERVYGRAA